MLPGSWWLVLAAFLVAAVAIGVLLYVQLQREPNATESNSLEALKQQYARGEIDETELETRADRLLHHES